MADISRITMPSGTTYDIKDTTARSTFTTWRDGPRPICSISLEEISDGFVWVLYKNYTEITAHENGYMYRFFEGFNEYVFMGASSGTNDYHVLLAHIGLDVNDALGVWLYDFHSTSATGGLIASPGNDVHFEKINDVDQTYSSSSTKAQSGTAVAQAIAEAAVGGASFQGIVNNNSTISSTNYTRGMYWVVGTAGTYVGQPCEKGDFVFAVADKGASYSATDFSVVQANIDLSIFGELAYKDSASGSFTPVGTVSTPTFTGSAMTSTGNFTPVGSVSAPVISVETAGSTTTVKNPTSVTVAKSVVAVSPSAPVPDNAITYYSVIGETLSLYQLGYTTGDSITTQNVTVKTGDATYSASAPAFTGTQGSVSVSGTPDGSVSQPTFTGTAGTVTVS